MTSRVEAIVKPELLVWGRESIGFSQEEVARKLSVKVERILEWEKGVSRPSINQLRRLAQVYKRPLAVFYLPEKPMDFQPLRDFRRFPDVEEFRQTPQLNVEIRRASYRRQVTLDLLQELNERPRKFAHTTTLRAEPERVGGRIRDILNITFKQQGGWRHAYEALNEWRSAVERSGVLVFQASGLDAREMRGFSIGEFPLPVIGLNTKDAPSGRVFTLLHEFTHLMLKQSGICDLQEEYKRQPEEQRIEVFCNHVAGAALIPKPLLLAEETVARRTNMPEWSDEELVVLSRRFKTSREVVLRRLLICQLTTDEFYAAKREEFLREYDDLSRKKKEGFVPPYRKVISTAGLAFVHLVLTSYQQEKITSSDVSDYFEVKLRHLPRIETEAMSRSPKHGVLF